MKDLKYSLLVDSSHVSCYKMSIEPPLKLGEIKRFAAKDGRMVVLRCIRWEDLDELVDLINSLIEEKAYIVLNVKLTRNQEIDWLARYLPDIEKGKRIGVVAEVDGHVASNGEVTVKSGAQSHVGELGIVIKSGYRDVGIGSEMIRVLVEESRKKGLKLLVLRLFAENSRARHVYEKFGFREVGRVPRAFCRGAEYSDEVIMALGL
jgi:RimJ/RimL family protein N-acetyltransferase